MYNCIFVIGATATGKTSLSVALAKKLNTEIINADSTQVYKELNIGTAKTSLEEMQGVPHNLINILEPQQEFSVGSFRELAMPIIKKLWDKHKIPIVVGGTGFYIESLFNNYQYASTAKNEVIRQALNDELLKLGNVAMYEKLQEVDKISAANIHPNDTKRVLRALEIFETTGKTRTELNNTMQSAINGNMQNEIKPLIIALNMDRQVLYYRINLRTDKMFANGLIEEAKMLYDKGYTSDLQSIKSIGYKELFDYFKGNCTLDQAKEKIKQNTRNYAKRQITWFKRYKNAYWFDVNKLGVDEMVSSILDIINKEK